MRFELKEYQSEATAKILKALDRSRSDWHTHKDRTAFALSSTTGSGKTVIAATVIEALLYGSSEFNFTADPTAVVLWVSKDPSLNEQTRARFIEAADRIPVSDLVLLDKTYAERSLQTRTVYFINPDKLRDGAGFTKHTDNRSVTFWEIIRNTVDDAGKTLYMVLDEAHEGMKKQASGDKTIVQKIINGNGANPAMPVVWGISATVKRFDDAMAKADAFTKRPNVVIDPKDVQDSGLLKNTLTLEIPDEPGDYETTMVRDATKDFVDVCDRWDTYAQDQKLDHPVDPLLVIQIPDKDDGERDSEKGRKDEDALIHRVLETVRKHWPAMPADCVAHVLGDRATVEVGSYSIPKVAPQDVQGQTQIRVLLAKNAVSTGWDCPRAEVLVSLRPGRDHDAVTQLLGRMVRTPLAQTTSEERLNAASCYLPRFDKATAKIVAEEIMGIREPEGGGAPGASLRKVLLKPVTLKANPAVAQDVWNLIESLPSQAKPTARPKPIKRLLLATQALSRDGIVKDADKEAQDRLFQVLDDFYAEHETAIEAKKVEVLTAEIRQIKAVRGESAATDEAGARDADANSVEDELRSLRRVLDTKVVNRYLARDIQAAINKAIADGEDPSAVDETSIRARAAAMGAVKVPDGSESIKEAVEDAADLLVKNWLSQHKSAIKALPDSRQPKYEQLRDMARGPEDAAIELKTEEQVDTVDTDRNLLPVAKKHVMSDAKGDFPIEAKLNRWERRVIEVETARGEVVGFYRNPSSASKNALRIPYRVASDEWKSVQPDLIFVTKTAAGLKPSIIDPHSAHQGDTSPKVKALSLYADKHGAKFERIIFIGVEENGGLYGIDLLDPDVRKAVYECAADTASIAELFKDHGTRYCDISA